MSNTDAKPVRIPKRFVDFVKRRRDDLSKRIKLADKESDRADWGPMLDVTPEERDTLVKWAEDMRLDPTASVADRSAAIKMGVNLKEAFKDRRTTVAPLTSTPPSVRSTSELDRIIAAPPSPPESVVHAAAARVATPALLNGPHWSRRVARAAGPSKVPADSATILFGSIVKLETLRTLFGDKPEIVALLDDVTTDLRAVLGPNYEIKRE